MEANKTFIIRHKETKEMWRAESGKSSWRAAGHAKLAWASSHYDHWNQSHIVEKCEKERIKPVASRSYKGEPTVRFPKFDEQSTWEIVELLPHSVNRLQEAEELLRFCLGRLTDYHFEQKVQKFLEDK